jgi:hypothetical protein
MRHFQAALLKSIPLALSACLMLIAGCGGKGSTKLTYGLPAAPLQFSIAMDKDGICTVGGGIVSSVGTFAIEHSFPTREELTYIIIRNRTRGTDTVFKISESGFVDLHAVGDHTFRMHREDNNFYFDITSEWGTLDFKAYPSQTAIARVDFGEQHPDAVVTNDRKLILEYPSIFKSSDTIYLDTMIQLSSGRAGRLEGGGLPFSTKLASANRP